MVLSEAMLTPASDIASFTGFPSRISSIDGAVSLPFSVGITLREPFVSSMQYSAPDIEKTSLSLNCSVRSPSV